MSNFKAGAFFDEGNIVEVGLRNPDAPADGDGGLYARDVIRGVELPGGGGGDFSTAEVTITATIPTSVPDPTYLDLYLCGISDGVIYNYSDSVIIPAGELSASKTFSTVKNTILQLLVNDSSDITERVNIDILSEYDYSPSFIDGTQLIIRAETASFSAVPFK